MMACDDRRDPPLCASAVAPTELQPSPSPAFTPRVSRVATIAVVAVVLCVCGVVFGGRVASSIRDVPGLAAAAAPGSLAASDDGVAAPVPLGVTTADADRGSSSGSARGDEGGGAVGVPPPLGGHDANGQAGHVRRPPPLRHVYRLPLDAAPPPDEPFDVPRAIAVTALPVDARRLRALTSTRPAGSATVAKAATAAPLPPAAAGIALGVTVQGAVRSWVAVQLNVTHLVVGTTAVPVVRYYRSLYVGVLSADAAAAVPAAARVSVAVDADGPWRVGPSSAAQRRAFWRGVRRERLQSQGGRVLDALVVNSTLMWGDVHLDGEWLAAGTPSPLSAVAAASPLNFSTPSASPPAADHALPQVPSASGVYATCAMTQSIYSAGEVLHWLDYHRRLGVDHLYLYANSPNSTAALAADLAHRPDVEVLPWPWRRSQFAASGHFLAAARSRCGWVALIDLDEWLLVREPALPPPPALPPRHRYGHHRGGGGEEETPQPPLLRALAALNASTGASTFVVPAVRMGSGGRVENPHIPYPDAYTYRVEVPGPGKPIALTADTFPLTHVHTVHLRAARARMTKVPGVRLRQPSSLAAAATSATELVAVTNTTPRAVAAGTSPDDIEEPLAPLVMVHYSTRSWVEEVAKRDAGRAAEEMGDFNNGHRRHGVTDPNDPSLAARRTRHLSLDGQTPWTEMRDAWRDVMRRPLRAPIVVPAEDDASRLTDWVDQPSLVPK
eukprot:contig_9720_g2320